MASDAPDESGGTHQKKTMQSDFECNGQVWPDVLTAKETAAYLRLDYQLVMRMTRAGLLPSLRAGRTWRYHRRALEQAMGADAIRQ
ncbi:helix-turn-helix domain-containing protein [Streptomyces syringium]|uniref:helix-turn-helix domain-containing protein n=1 Tax=Streptomyces syringium TaxID=76729 RepID=UPI0033FF37F9